VPDQVNDCIKTCDDSSKSVAAMHQTTKEINITNVNLTKNKVEKSQYFENKEKTDNQIEFLNTKYNAMQTKRDKLENYIDIYLPLKVQHMITETLHVCLFDKK